MPRAASKTLSDLLQQVWDLKGTDLLITAGAPPWVRLDQRLEPLEGEPVLRPSDTEKLVLSALSEAQAVELARHKEIDFSFNWEGQARFRGNAFHQRDSLAMALRLIPVDIPTMDDLGIPDTVRKMTSMPSGMVLFTGPTGSGKSTTQAALIDHINSTRPCHVITIEDPIEYLHHHRVAAVEQREVGNDTESFARALRSALREDPDVLLVGEMRDRESTEIALAIAETGHLVFATLHTNDTAQALDRVVGIFPAEQHDQIRLQLSACLQGVVYQRLLPRLGGGLVSAYEILVGTHAVRNLIREGKSRQIRNALTMGQQDGMQTLEMSLSELVNDGVVGYEEAIARSLFPKDVAKPEYGASLTEDLDVTVAESHPVSQAS
jgi:twitching motility protein PilT